MLLLQEKPIVGYAVMRWPWAYQRMLGVILFGREKPEASTSLPKILRHSTKPTFRRF
jgi:hypothetical protein